MPKVQQPDEFLEDFLAIASEAKERIYVQSMNFETGPKIERVVDVLLKKAKQGLDVRLFIDWVAQRYVNGRISIIPSFSPRQMALARRIHKRNELLRKELQQGGVIIQELHKPSIIGSLLPIAGRNHKKIYLIDHTAVWIGGVNLYEKAFTNLDCMIKWEEPNVIATLGRQFPSILKQSDRNQEIPLTDSTKLLVDSGTRAQSLIYYHAVELVRKAKSEIIFMSQFVPDGPLLGILAEKPPTLPVTVLTSPRDVPAFTRFPEAVPYFRFKRVLAAHPNISLHHLTRFVHAKILLVDRNVALCGSHNLVNIGVQLGTAEIAIETEDKTLVNHLLAFTKTSLKNYQ